MRNLYINHNLHTITEAVRTKDIEGYQKTLEWANEMESGFITHKAHYEMERCMQRIPFSDSIWTDPPANGDPEWVYALSRHSHLWCLAKAYSYTGDRKYIRVFERIIDSFLENTSYDSRFTGTTWRSLETGIRPENWIRSLELFRELGIELGRNLERRMQKSLESHIRQLTETHRTFHRLSNWGIIQNHGLFISGVFLKDEEAVDTAMGRLEEELSLSILSDGNQFEQSPLYHSEVLHSLLDILLVADNRDIAVPNIFRSKASEMATALYSQKSMKGCLFLQGDSDEIEIDDLLYTAGKLLNRKELLERETEETIWDFGPSGAKASEHVFASAALETSGNYFLRGENIEARFFAGQIGSGHGNISPLHTDIYFKGIPFSSDSGRFTYESTSERLFLRSAEAHNTVILNGKFPDRPVGSWSFTSIPEILKGQAILQDEYDFVEASHLSYLEIGSVIRRRVLRLGKSTLIVSDDILSSRENLSCVTWNLYPGTEAEELDSNSMILRSGDTSLLFWHSQNKLEMADSITSPHYNEMRQSRSIHLLETTRGNSTLISIFTGITDTSIRKQDLFFLESGKRIPGVGITLKSSDEEWDVILRANEAVGQVDLVTNGRITGYGRVFLKRNSWPYSRTVMA